MTTPDTFESLLSLAKVKPSAAISFLRQRSAITTDRYGELEAEAHAKAFTSAGMTEARMLNQVHEALLRAQGEGTGFDVFQKRFLKIAQEHAWQPRNPFGVKDAVSKRAFLIYQTNISTAFSAGKWARLNTPEAIEMYPWFRYRHHACAHPRLLHESWDGIILPRDDPFWDTHWAPNGWHCHCTVEAVSRRDMRKNNWTVSESPKVEWVEVRNPATGKMVKTPKGIDLGFAYNPGKVWQAEEQRRAEKAVKPLVSVGGIPKATVPAPVLQEAQKQQIEELWEAKSGTAEAGRLAEPAQDLLQELDPETHEIAVQRGLAEHRAPEWDGSVHLTAETLNKERLHHAELGKDEFLALPQILAGPQALVSVDETAAGVGVGVIGLVGKQHYYAVVRLQEGAEAAKLMTYHALNEKDRLRLLRRRLLWEKTVEDSGSEPHG